MVKDENNITNPYSVLDPYKTYDKSQDGVIFQDGSIYKNNNNVNINVTNNGVQNTTLADSFVDNVSNVGKALYNLLPAAYLDQSGWYGLNDGSSTGSWTPGNSLNQIRTNNNNACWK